MSKFGKVEGGALRAIDVSLNQDLRAENTVNTTEGKDRKKRELGTWSLKSLPQLLQRLIVWHAFL